MITLTLLGSVALLWVAIHFIWRSKRERRNPYSKFLRNQSVEDLHMGDLRTLKLRIATHEARVAPKNNSTSDDVQDKPS